MIANPATLSTPAERGRWIPWAILAFFVVVAAVNAVMIWFAVRTFPGLDSPRTYELGLHYNQTLAAIERQKALGWSGTVSGAMTGGFDAEIRIAMLDNANHTLTGAAVTAMLLRPGDKSQDMALRLDETAPGTYAGRVVLPAVGNWDAEVTVEHGSDRWVTRERLMLR